MAGELNGTGIILQNGAGAIVGQVSVTVTHNGTPIDISNKSNGDWRTLLAGEKSGRSVDFGLELIHNNDANYQAVRKADQTATTDPYTLTFVSDLTTDEEISGNFMVTGMSDSIPHGDKFTCSLTLQSSGAVTYTDPVA